MGQGSTDVQHIAAWDVPLEPRDSRWPPAELKPPFSDPKPIQMMTSAQFQAALAELGRSVPLPKARPKRREQCQNRQLLRERHHLQVRRPKRKPDPSRQNLKLLLIGLSNSS